MTAPARSLSVPAPRLTATQQRYENAARVRELKSAFARWARKCFFILDKEEKLQRLVLNPVQVRIEAAEQYELKMKGRARIYVLKGRQGGVTTHQQAKGVHTIWSRKGAGVLTLAHDRDTTDKIFDKITLRAINHFPLALLPPMGPRETREISFPTRESSFYTGTAGAKRAGRSLTLARFHGSEFALWDEPKKTLNRVAPALEKDNTTMILETTGSGFDSDGHNFWREAQEGGNSYVTLFFPWWECDPKHYRSALLTPDELGSIEPDEHDLIVRFRLSLEQIKWRRQKIKDMGRDEFLQEYAEDEESCWLSTGGMFYNAVLLKSLMMRVPEPSSTDLGGALELYVDMGKRPSSRVIIGADTAEGGGDRSSFTARTLAAWRLLAQYASSQVEPREFAGILNTWGRRFSTGNQPALLVVEKNAHGITVLRHLRDDHKYPLSFIYHRVAADKAGDPKSERMGWHTDEESKPLLLDAGRELLNAANEGRASIPSRAALRDASAIRRNATGRVSLNSRDVLTSETLAWMGRSYPINTQSFVPQSESTFTG